MPIQPQRELLCYRMDGTGNNFVVIDALTQQIAVPETQLGNFLGAISEEHNCDQTLLLLPPESAHNNFSLRMFNADGGEVEQCGNGVRCIMRFAIEQGLAPGPQLSVRNLAGDCHGQLLASGKVRVQLPVPSMRVTEPREGNGDYPPFHPVSLGNPHAVIFVNELDDASSTNGSHSVAKLGKIMQRHPDYPDGVNVSVAQIMDRNQVSLQVYERGVGETQACGSGAAATVIAGQRRDTLDTMVQVSMPGGTLLIEWLNGAADTVVLTGATQLHGSFVHSYHPRHIN